MEKKNVGIIATVATALMCGCPGLAAVCFGLISAVVSRIPGAELDFWGSSDPQTALVSGIGAFCLGAIFVAIPVIVGFITLRKKPEDLTPPSNEPIPPAI